MSCWRSVWQLWAVIGLGLDRAGGGAPGKRATCIDIDDGFFEPSFCAKTFSFISELKTLSIPAKLHFCWIGVDLPWAYVFAALSAAKNSEMLEVILHHTDTLIDSDALTALRQNARVKFNRVEPETLLLEAGGSLGVSDRLYGLYTELRMPVVRADVLRAAILYVHGGVYADLDTITVASLLPLIDAGPFVGQERIVWPQSARLSGSLTFLAGRYALDVIRKIWKSVPNGWRGFRHLERFYALGVNNAIMGAEAGSDFMAAYLLAMLDLSKLRRNQRFALGPHLLQDVVRRYRTPDLRVEAPEVFYPLPPEISEHWFRRVRNPQLNRIIFEKTRLVHWYASVRTKELVAEISPAYVLENCERQLYSALVYANIDDLAGMAMVQTHGRA